MAIKIQFCYLCACTKKKSTSAIRFCHLSFLRRPATSSKRLFYYASFLINIYYSVFSGNFTLVHCRNYMYESMYERYLNTNIEPASTLTFGPHMRAALINQWKINGLGRCSPRPVLLEPQRGVARTRFFHQ